MSRSVKMMSSSKHSPAATLLSFLLLLLCHLITPTSTAALHPYLDSVSELWQDPFRALQHVPFVATSYARVDWKETSKGHVISLDLPGMTKEEVQIEVENWVLKVSGDRKRAAEKRAEKCQWHLTERSYGKFWRQFGIPENADLASVKAKLEDGVLTLTFVKLSPDMMKGPKTVGIDNAGGGDSAAAASRYKIKPEL